MAIDFNEKYETKTDQVLSSEFVVYDEIQLGAQPTHVVAIIHGIRDHGVWGSALAYAARQAGLNMRVQPVSYGWLGVIPFLIRFGNHKIENKVARELEEIHDSYPEAKHSLIAHSNGTKIASSLIHRLSFKYSNIIFLGSISKQVDASAISMKAETVVNDCSPKDYFPILAEAINPLSFEATGTFGFRRNGIEDRFFNVNHGGCTTEDHFIMNISPLLIGNTLKLGERPRQCWPSGSVFYIRFLVFFFIVLVFYDEGRYLLSRLAKI